MKRYLHKTNSNHQTTMDIGLLYPVQFLDVLAGQTTWLNTSALCRFQPLIAPAFVKMNMHIVHFYVPYRLLWDQWLDFISGQANIEVPLTKIKVHESGLGPVTADFRKTLLDFFGFPMDYGDSGFEMNFNFFPFLAYSKIWNEHFRDTSLQQEIDEEALNALFIRGLDNSANRATFEEDFKKMFALKRVNWGRDRFTSALLETEADPAVSIPIAGVTSGPVSFGVPNDPSGRTGMSYITRNSGVLNASFMRTPSDNNPADVPYHLDIGKGFDFSLSDFKLATAIYNFQINQNKFGRDVDAYFRKYGLRNLDNRLQRSEYIGGFAETMQVSDIIATDGQDLGKQGGHAVGYAKKRAFKHFAPEHGLILTLAYIRPKANYTGGIDRFFLKRDMLDFYQAEFANVGYQPIYSSEVGTEKHKMDIPVDENDMQIFGYEHRYEEYRRENSHVSGELRPGQPLAHWSNPRNWDSIPVLNSNFIECNPSNQIWSSPSTDKAIVYFKRNVMKKCFVPKSSDPKIKL